MGKAKRQRLVRAWMAQAVAVLAVVPLSALTPGLAHAHGVVGKRFLPGTMSIDDPFVDDEAGFVGSHRSLGSEVGGGHTTGLRFDATKRITPELGISIGAEYQRVKPAGESAQYGFDNFELGLKYQVVENDEHEAAVSIGVEADLGGTGTPRVGAESFSTISPALFYGKGLGDLPEGAAWLRPLAITGVLAPRLPTRSLEPKQFDWGFTIQYSIQYLQNHVKDVGLPPPFNRMILLMEVPVKTCASGPCSGQTSGSVNPGLIWLGRYIQLGAEATIPVNRRSGRDVGVLLQLHFFLDDMYPNGYGKPIFRRSSPASP